MYDEIDFNNKEQVLRRILELKSSIEQKHNQYEEELEAYRDVAAKKDDIGAALTELKKKVQEISETYFQLTSSINILDRQRKEEKAELERLQRALSRLQDVDRLNE